MDVGGAQVKVELPQPSRLETLYVRMEQVRYALVYPPQLAGTAAHHTISLIAGYVGKKEGSSCSPRSNAQQWCCLRIHLRAGVAPYSECLLLWKSPGTQNRNADVFLAMHGFRGKLLGFRAFSLLLL